jgi:UDP-GlcNAc:undecaprenyl-phosphate/decaprenyl-phosphate GlcNAc-1-phosphate transferase
MRPWQLTIVGLASFIVVAVLVPLCRRIALARGIADEPGPGKVHANPTPYLGGVAIALGASTCSLFLPRWQAQGAAILGAALLLATLGLVDDIRTVKPSVRLAVEGGAAAVAVAAGARIHLFGDVPDIALSILWIVVIANAFNLLDNMDGAVGSIAPMIATALAVTALLEGQVLVGGLAIVVASACLGFLLYNWSPASIFMGDAGSLFVGFLLAVIALKLRTDADRFASAVAVVLLVGPAVFDTTLVTTSRLRAHKHIFIGGTDHTSHRLRLLGVPPRTVVGLLVAGTAASAALGTLVAEGIVPPWPAVLGASAAFVVALVLLLRVGTYLGTDESRNAFGRAPQPDERSGYGERDTPAPVNPRGHPHRGDSSRRGGGTTGRRRRRSGRTTR